MGLPHDPTDSPWQTLSSELIYDNPWISLEHRRVITPGGSEGIYGRVHFKNWAIGVVPLDAQGNTVLVGQFRYPLGRYSWEIPEGGGLLEASPLEGAQRELAEETGLGATHWQLIQQMDLSNSVTDEQAFLFVAQGLSQGQATPDETEDLRLRHVPLTQAVDMVLSGEITDSLSVVALLKVERMLRTGELKLR